MKKDSNFYFLGLILSGFLLFYEFYPEGLQFLIRIILWFVCVGIFISLIFVWGDSLYAESWKEWKNLAPNLIRQRCKIEILVDHVVTPEEIKDFLPKLSEVLGMQMLEVSAYEAVIDGKFVGYGGWIHWVTSGAHVYSYTAEKTQAENWCLFSIDPYTCKPFDLEKAYKFTKEYFKIPEERIAAKEC